MMTHADAFAATGHDNLSGWTCRDCGETNGFEEPCACDRARLDEQAALDAESMTECRRCGETHGDDDDAAYDCALNFHRTYYPGAD